MYCVGDVAVTSMRITFCLPFRCCGLCWSLVFQWDRKLLKGVYKTTWGYGGKGKQVLSECLAALWYVKRYLCIFFFFCFGSERTKANMWRLDFSAYWSWWVGIWEEPGIWHGWRAWGLVLCVKGSKGGRGAGFWGKVVNGGILETDIWLCIFGAGDGHGYWLWFEDLQPQVRWGYCVRLRFCL